VTFKDAVEATPDLQNAWRSGLRALRRTDRQHVDAQDGRRLAESVDVDSALAAKCPTDPRWDYGVGYDPVDASGETVYWIEIHPARSGEIDRVLARLAWLKAWLAASAPRLHVMRKAFVWISSGKTSFTLSSPQQKRFALVGLRHVGRTFRLS
jgi:hypothetical protein